MSFFTCFCCRENLKDVPLRSLDPPDDTPFTSRFVFPWLARLPPLEGCKGDTGKIREGLRCEFRVADTGIVGKPPEVTVDPEPGADNGEFTKDRSGVQFESKDFDFCSILEFKTIVAPLPCP